MKREKEVPAEFLEYQKKQKEPAAIRQFNTLKIYCAVPVRAVKMKMIRNMNYEEDFRTAIIPSVDVYTSGKAFLRKDCLKRDALSYFISNTHTVFPYGHIYADSGYVCLGTIFVPSAVPKRSPTLPLETLFLHNDRNLSHGGGRLFIDGEQALLIHQIMRENEIKLSSLSEGVEEHRNLIKYDEIWNLSADVADQKALPEALNIMSQVYDVIFKKENEEEEKHE